MNKKRITVKRKPQLEWNVEIYAPNTIQEHIDLFGLVETEAMLAAGRDAAYEGWVRVQMGVAYSLAQRADGESGFDVTMGVGNDDAQEAIDNMDWHPYCDAPVTKTRQLAMDFLELNPAEIQQWKEDVEYFQARRKEYGTIKRLGLDDVVDNEQAKTGEQQELVDVDATPVTPEEKAALAGKIPATLLSEGPPAPVVTDVHGTPVGGKPKQEGPPPIETTPIRPAASAPQLP
jgi:hypothetical protein